MSTAPKPTRGNRQIGRAPAEGPPGDEAFRLLVEAVLDYAIFLLSAEGRVLTWNLGAERIKGYSASEIIGQDLSIFYTPEDRAHDRPKRILAMADRDGRCEDEGWRVRKDGSLFWADVVVTALRGADGKTYGYAKVTRDLSERRAAEARERKLLAAQEARHAAEEALRARDQFLGIASHELKTPIASLHLAAQALEHSRRAGKLDNDRLENSLKRMSTATERLTSLVNELLDVTRLTASVTYLSLARTDVGALLRDRVAGFVDAGYGDRIRLRVAAETTATVDAGRLDQVVTNLVDNALKYSSAVVDVELEPVDDGVWITVTDVGIGLDADALQHLFQPFGRAPNAAEIQGMGLGLYIARQIVERHGGWIRASSPGPNLGATFRVWLPTEPGQADEQA
jgi:PAS domain S-box-containing protein